MQFQTIDFFIFLTITVILYYRSPAHIQVPVAILAVLLPFSRYGMTGRAFLFSITISITVVVAGYLRTQNKDLQARNILLCLANFFFYAYSWFGIIFLWVALFVSLCAYLSARIISNTASPVCKKTFLAFSIATVLLPLIYFKYTNFVFDTILGFSPFQEISLPAGFLPLLLPVGISFYTFKAVSYVVDVYRRQIPARISLIDVVVYVTFFPTILSGPIDRSKAFFSQLYARTDTDAVQIKTGMLLIIAGMMKKLIVADALKPMVDQSFNNPDAYSGLSLLLAAYTYSFQLYCDFAGYTDIAIGCALVLGFHMPPNFKRPYFAPNIAEFWRRWHMSLSYWLRDYLYIPLGGSRCSLFRVCCNLLITMLIAGLWHGAGWNFIFWGAMHGSMLVIHRLFRHFKGTRQEAAGKNIFIYVLSILANFSFVTCAWIFFRAETWHTAVTIITRIVQGAEGLTAPYVMALVLIPLFIGTEIIQSKISIIQRIIRYPRMSRMAIYFGLLLVFILITSTRPFSFVYFRF